MKLFDRGSELCVQFCPVSKREIEPKLPDGDRRLRTGRFVRKPRDRKKSKECKRDNVVSNRQKFFARKKLRDEDVAKRHPSGNKEDRPKPRELNQRRKTP